MTEPNNDIEIEIFKPGAHVSTAGDEIAFSAADVRRTAEVYDPATFEAPVCVGHPKIDAPAYGWVSGLRVDGDGVLFARLTQVDPAFSDLVKAGRYKKVSAAFFARGSSDDPWRLRHVGFLGAAAPAVQGLKPATFAAGNAVEFAADAWRVSSFMGSVGLIVDTQGRAIPTTGSLSVKTGVTAVLSTAASGAILSGGDSPEFVFADALEAAAGAGAFIEVLLRR